MICGIDEAGKGSVLGPMVIGGVMGENPREFEKHGYADSKTLTPKRREELYEEITSQFKTSVVILSAEQIDECRKIHSMNVIVAKCHAKALEKLLPPADAEAYIDACDVNEIRHGIEVAGYMKNPVKIVSEHKADFKYPVVSAASIVAKVTRDRLIEELAAEYGDIGSGYPSDPVTVKYLEDSLRDGKTPVIARKSWKTVSNIAAKVKQKSLFDF